MTQRLERHACFGGWQDVYRHRSEVLDCDMTVGVYFPPQAEHGPCPVLYWLSGLTCTEHDSKDVEATIAAFDRVIARMSNDGYFDGL